MHPPSNEPSERDALIARARAAVIELANPPDAAAMRIAPSIGRSWQRCLAAGQQPQQRVTFDAVTQTRRKHTSLAGHTLVQAARPVLDQLARAIAGTRYFAMLTDARGIVLDQRGLPVDAPRAARDMARIGVDLSERAVGTTAIGTALAERQAVWLHRGEHFFDDNAVFSCAGAPLFGPLGDCIGMLDLTGVEVVERPELVSLAVLAARRIENALVLGKPHALRVRLSWPGSAGDGATDALMGFDADGCLTAANRAARELAHLPPALDVASPSSGAQCIAATATALHASDCFAMDWRLLWQAAGHQAAEPVEVLLWSGLRMQAHVERVGNERRAVSFGSMPNGGGVSRVAATSALPAAADALDGTAASAAARPTLRDAQCALIRQAVQDAHGNVAEAARVLGISRATVYRKLGAWRSPSAD